MAHERYRLKLSKLKFCSLVDDPAQPNAKTLLIKRNGKREGLDGVAQLAKFNEELGLAFFWAFTCTNPDGTEHFDLQNDTVDQDFIKAAMDFMVDGGGAVDEMHDENATDGKVVFAFPMTPDIASAFGVTTKQSGLMIAIKPTTEQLAKLKDGTFNGVSIGGLGTRELVKSQKGRVCKANLYTDEVDGHQHQIHCYEDGTFWVQHATSEGAEQSHSHGIVFEDGKLTILADSGHSHALAEGQPGVAVVPADAVVIVAARAPRAFERATSNANKSTTAKPGSTVGSHTERSTMKDLETLSKQLDEVTKRAERAERIAKMSGAHKTHFDTLSGDEAEAFLAKSAADRDAQIAKAVADDPIEVTFDGVDYRKSAGPAVLSLAKAAKAQAELLEKADIEKQATAHLGNCPGDADTHRFIVKAVLATKNPEMIGKAFAALDGANAVMKSRGTAAGGDGAGTGDAEQTADAYEALAKGLTAFCKAEKIDKVWTVGLQKFVATSEGAALKQAHDAARAAG